MPTTHDGVRQGENLLDAVTWIREQPLSLSSVETFIGRVEQIGVELRASNVVEIANARGLDLADEPRRSVRS